jgi:uncharacterized protein (TIGR03067 family)
VKTLALAAGLLVAAGAAAVAEDKIDLAGKYALVGGKIEGKDLDERAKKAKYTATADTFTVEGKGAKFVFSYKVKPGTPAEIDMSVLEGPDGTKGAVAVGIVEVKGDTVKLAYSLDKEKRPKDFTGKSDYLIELKKLK